ncbi:MAG: flagellar basal body P-ring protein FlgI [Planctomycetes bacterium]|nr:flagellar basal body P-ring protein FlgI [Planctomycetota bacterium]
MPARSAAVVVWVLLAGACFAGRIKDIAELHGPMENPIEGYGLIVGLNGTGDDAKFQPAIKLLSNMLSNLGAGVLPAEVLGTKNVAVVTVSATLPPFNKVGDRIDIQVAAVGNTKSLAGGRLELCPLGAGGRILAIASGSLRVDALNPTTAVIEKGAIIQRSVPADLTPGGKLTFKLLAENVDYSIATRIVNAINEDYMFGADSGGNARPIARAADAKTIEVTLTPEQLANPVPFIYRLERLTVPGLEQAMEARVVIDEKNGTFFAINGNVEISPVVVGHGNLQVEIKKNLDDQTSTLDDLVAALRDLDAAVPDVIGILKALEAAGALHAKVIRK